MAMENPFFAGLTVYHNFFNWTMTYRTDSDIFHPYGAFVKSYVPGWFSNLLYFPYQTHTLIDLL